MKEHKHKRPGRGRKFWACIFFALLFLGILCCILCKLDLIDKKIEDIECCCPPTEMNYEICIDTFYTERYDAVSMMNLPDTVYQKYYCSQVVLSGVNSSNQNVVDSLIDKWNLIKVDSCICDSIVVLGKGVALGPEEKGQTCRSEIEHESGKGPHSSLNYILDVPSKPYSGRYIPNPEVDSILALPKRTRRTGKKIKVAVIDTGINFKHDSLKAFKWVNIDEENGDPKRDEDTMPNCISDDEFGYDFVNNSPAITDYNGHGTHIAGIITAWDSFDFDVEIMNLKVMGKEEGNLFHLLCGLQYAINNQANIINLSLGFYSDTLSVSLGNMLKKTENDKILVVTSAGNEGSDNELSKHQPSNFTRELKNLISVASLDKVILTDLWEDSNYGLSTVDIAVPGVEIISTYIDSQGNNINPMGRLSGTSMAAAHVSRLGAMILSNNPTFNGIDAKTCIEANGIILTQHSSNPLRGVEFGGKIKINDITCPK